MAEYYLSHEPRIIVAEVPSDDPPPEVPPPLAAEEWVSGWLITAPASPGETPEIMGALAPVAGKLPQDTLLLFPYDPPSVADVLANWLEALEKKPEALEMLEEEVEDNPEAFRNLILGEKTLWKGMKDILGVLPKGKPAIRTIEAYEAILGGALADYHDATRKGLEALSPEAKHELSKKARRILLREKGEALLHVVGALSPGAASRSR